jgi:two-component system response regulator YesN
MEHITQENVIKLITKMLSATLKVETNYLIPPYDNLEQLDHGLMKVIYNNFDYKKLLQSTIIQEATNNTIYFLHTMLEQNYAIFKLPNNEICSFYVIGPFLYEEPNFDFYERVMTQNRISSSAMSTLKTYYSTVPVISEMDILPTVHTIAPYIFDKYNPDNVKYYNFADRILFLDNSISVLNFSMDILEERYQYENQLLDAISKGASTLAMQLLPNMGRINFPPRVGNPMRDLKNLLIILNTLYRKAAEKGKVHPVYLDDLSTKFSIKIERTNDLNQLQLIPVEMTRKYCLLVNNYSLMGYSHTIRRAIDYIKLNLSSPLSLKILSENLNLNAAYLSAQFKAETKLTITEYIHKEKINAAIQFLNSTSLPIQEVAFRVGFDDFNYFTRLFKKQIKLSPFQYRNMMLGK